MKRQESDPSKAEVRAPKEKLVGPFAVARQLSDYGSDTLRVLDGNGQLKIGGIDIKYEEPLQTIIEAANKGIDLPPQE